MKKQRSLILTAILFLTLTACGKAPDAVPTAAPTAVPTTAVPTVTEEIPALGTVTEDGYENRFLGIRCDLGSGWTYYSGAETEQIRQTEQGGAAAYGSYLITDMAAQNALTGDAVNITLEYLGLMESELSTKLYIEAAVTQLAAELSDMGLEAAAAEAADIMFLGAPTAGIRISGVTQGHDYSEALVFIRTGRYIATVSASAFGSDTTQEILDCFTRLE